VKSLNKKKQIKKKAKKKIMELVKMLQQL